MQQQQTCFVGSLDPNDIYGPVGVGDVRYVGGAYPLSYNIVFENKAEATAAAQEVVITNQLDKQRFDLSTFSLGPIGFGDLQIEPPPGLQQYATDIDLRPANNLIVRLNASLDEATGVVTWRFVSLDPATGLPTTDALAGFLPPNNTSPEGEGSLFYTVALKPGWRPEPRSSIKRQSCSMSTRPSKRLCGATRSTAHRRLVQ